MFNSVNAKLSQAVDDIPFDDLNISDEVKEQVNIIMCTKIELDLSFYYHVRFRDVKLDVWSNHIYMVLVHYFIVALSHNHCHMLY